MEKRSGSRIGVAIEVDMAFLGGEARGVRTRNVSLGGVLLERGDYPVPRVGAAVDLTFRALNGARRSIRARVARIDDSGVALLFRELEADDFEFLQLLVQRPSG